MKILPTEFQESEFATLQPTTAEYVRLSELRLSFEWWIYVMVELRILWSYGKSYIWKSELIFPSDKRNYSELT